MDDLALIQHWQEVEEEMELQEDYENTQITAMAGLIFIGVEEARLSCACNRNPSWLYLRRAQLLPNPHANTP